ncbi:oxidoreductase family protein [Mycena vitilis]|nr:oxidoreductase family protein [Mycena vitilis]
MSSPPRIRVALIGLSSTAATSWAANAHLPYLLSPRGLARFQIVALSNSSVDAARAAITHHGLDPAVVHAHGDADSLAADSSVDLVVCNTRVDKHYETIAPSVRAGKDVYCEWPLAENAARARELVEFAKQGGGKTVVGLQGRFGVLGARVQSLLGAEGPIGRILSFESRSVTGGKDRDVWTKSLAYFTRREIGGNPFTIHFGHLIDLVQTVVGEADVTHAHLHIQHPTMRIRDPATNTIVETVRSDVPDFVVATGTIRESPLTQKGGASLLMRQRRGPPSQSEPVVVWTITGEKGEIRLASTSSNPLSIGPDRVDEVVIEVHDFATDTVSKVEWDWEDWQKDLPVIARNVGGVYEALVEGQGYATFQDALRRHEQLDAMLAGWKAPEA